MPIDEQITTDNTATTTANTTSTASSPTASTTNTNTTTTTTGEPRRKRAKIVSACSECRRKKTKCNGETPCRNCEKSGVSCVYPSSSSSNDDKRNAPSKAALEAIEERLKAIEDMLRAIIKSQNIFSVEMDPVVSNFLQRGESSSPPPSSSAHPSTSNNNNNLPISYSNHHHHHHQQVQQQQQQQPLTPQSTTSQPLVTHSSPPPQTPSSPLQNRLPSIRTLSTPYPEPKLEHRDLPPLGFHGYAYPPPNPQQCKYQENDEQNR